MMKKILAVTVFTVVLGSAGTAYAGHPDGPFAGRGPSGSTKSADGDVRCGHYRTIIDSPVVVHNGFAGTEVCHDDVGRVYLMSNWDKPDKGPIYLPDFVRADFDRDFILIPGDDVHIELPF